MIAQSLAELDLDVGPFDGDLAIRTGLLRPGGRADGLSLGDRACLALAEQFDGIALATDGAWLNAPVQAEVELIRRA